MLRSILLFIFLGALFWTSPLFSAHFDIRMQWSFDRLYHGGDQDAFDTFQSFVEVSNGDVFQTKSNSQFTSIDAWARRCPKSVEMDLVQLTKYLIQPTKTQLEKARALFIWMTDNIQYDDLAYNTGNYPEYTPQNVLKSRKAVCEGFSVLFAAMCEEAGLEAEKIHGYAKGYGYHLGQRFTDINHAWNAVKIDGQWRFFDVTWSEGFGENVNGKLVSTKSFEPFWFDVDPKAFVFTHFPQNIKWLYIDEQMTLKQFETLPEVHHSFFQLGFQSDEVFSKAISLGIRYFVQTYPTKAKVEAVRMPMHIALVKGKQMTFEFHSDANAMAVADERGNWTYFKKDGNVFTLDYTPSGNKLHIMVKGNEKAKFETLATYKVK